MQGIRTDQPLASLTPATLRLRLQARAAGYNPDQPNALAALACVVGIDTDHLAAALTGRADLDQQTQVRVSRALGVDTPVAPVPDPSTAEALRRVTGQQAPIARIERRDVRNTIADFRRW